MGKAIEGFALERGHDVVSIITEENLEDFDSESFKSADVAIEFSIPSSAFDNACRAIDRGVAVVSGTTGWTDRLDELKAYCEAHNGTFLHSTNYSIGVNVLFAMNKYLAKIMNRFPQYDVKMREVHHIHKLDHPSGTALTLANGIISTLDRKEAWAEHSTEPSQLDIEAVREGEVPGIHEVKYLSAQDEISIRHEAFSRDGFALGAVVAAEWICDKKGWKTIEDIYNF